MTEMSEKENEPDDAATHTPPGTVSALQETKVTREARGLDPCPVRPQPGHQVLSLALSFQVLPFPLWGEEAGIG